MLMAAMPQHSWVTSEGLLSYPCTNQDSCDGDFHCDGDLDGTDAARFKEDFGRSPFINPCPACLRAGRSGAGMKESPLLKSIQTAVVWVVF